MEVKQQIREWWDDAQHDYDAVDAHGVHSKEEKEIWQDVTFQLLGPAKGSKVLDIGTGTGFLALLLAEMGHDVTGADWSERKLEIASKKINNSSTSIKFVIEDAEDLTFEDGQFDAVISRHLIWTLSDPYSAFKEWARVTKPGGKVMSDIPGEHSHPGNHHFGEDIGKELPFYNGADPKEVVDMFEDAGLVDVSVRRYKNLVLVEGKRS